MSRPRKQLPKYCHHQPTNRAFVRIEGKMYYLGRYGSEASRQEYDRIIAEFVANGRQSLNRSDDILVETLIARFLDYAEKECDYCENTKIRSISTLRMLNKLYGKLPVTNFTPTALKTLRHHYLEQGLARNTINKYIRIIRQVFSWGCEEEIVPADIAGALRMVRNLQKGRSSAVDYDAITPVPDDTVEKTLPHIKSSQIQDMVRVQRFISGRPQDIHNMRPCDINRSGEIWKYTPFTHKTKKRGKTRELPIGPRAQQILLPYLENCADPKQWVFPIIHWKMRKTLLETFDKIYILNLHGNIRRKETAPDGGKDESVFSIMQGTSINMFIRTPAKREGAKQEGVMGKVFYADLYGKRSDKYTFLETQTLETTGFTELPQNKPEYFFVPKDLSLKDEYDKGFGVNELFIKHGTGIKFRRDNLLVKNHYTRHDVETMLCDFSLLDSQELLARYKTQERNDWQLKEKRQYFLNVHSEDIVPVLYRVFDMRWTYFPMDKISHIIPRGDARKDLMRHLLRENLVLLTLRNQPTVQNFDRVFIAKGIIEHCVIGRGTYAFPLYCYDNKGNKHLNLNERIVGEIADRVGYTTSAIDIFDYIYGLLHDPQYRAKYQEFLRIDFPRVQYPMDVTEFTRYVRVGSRLRTLHLFEDIPESQPAFPISGDNTIGNVHFNDGKVFINATQYFEGVPLSIWEFYIGGSCPAQKYLKDRKGRVLAADEIQHYKKIIAVLKETVSQTPLNALSQ